MNGKKSRVLAALFLSVVLLLTIAPMVAFAQDAPVADTPTAEPATATPVTPTATSIPATATLVPTNTPTFTPVPTNTPTPAVVPPTTPVTVPEPVTVVLFGTGLAALSAAVATRRRRDDSG